MNNENILNLKHFAKPRTTMAPAIVKSKPKGREGRQSRSRNTTPSSTVSAPITINTPSHTAFLDIPLASLMIPTNITYEDVLDRHGGGGGIPDPKHLEQISNDLKTLAALANARSDANNKGMRDLSEKRKQVIEDERDREQAARQREEKERESLKREAEDDEELRWGNRNKKKKERSAAEERPLNHGAHGLARQDGLDLPLEGTSRLLLNLRVPYPKRPVFVALNLYTSPVRGRSILVFRNAFLVTHARFCSSTRYGQRR